MSEGNDKDDDVLDTYLSGDSELSRRYRSGGAPQPSTSVDRVILDAARAEAAREAVVGDDSSREGAARDSMAGKEAPAPTLRRRRMKLTWERPLAIAAAVVLSAILVVSMEREAGLSPSEVSETNRSLDDGHDASRPAAGRADQRPAAPEQQAETSAAPRVLSDAPASSEAARADKERAARGIFTNRLLKETAEPESRSPAADDQAIQDALALIHTAWMRGEAKRAEQLLESFREAYPDVGEERLREALPAALLDRDGSR